MDYAPTSATRKAASTKIVIAGGFGVGKTTFVGSVSEIVPLRTEALVTNESEGVDDLAAVPSKSTTTVAMDFGRLTLAEDLVLYLFGTPGQRRFWFMWDDLCLGAIGAIVLVDTARLDESFSPLDYFESKGLPFIVAVNQFDGVQHYTLEEVADALALPATRPDHQRRRPRPRIGQGRSDPGQRVRPPTTHRVHHCEGKLTCASSRTTCHTPGHARPLPTYRRLGLRCRGPLGRPWLPAAQTTTPSTSAAPLNPVVIKDGTLTVCADMPYEPFESMKGGKPVGFDIDLVGEVAKQLDIKPVILDTDFDAITSGDSLNSGDCDVAISAMTITGERARVLDFSSPYFDASQAMVVTKQSGLKSLEDLSGKKIAVQTEHHR